MTELASLFAVAISLYAVALNLGLKKQTKKKPFPTCYECKETMKQFLFFEGDLPTEVEQYLAKHKLPLQVVRCYRCPVFHRELWIAPAVTGQEKGLFQSRELN